MSDAALATWLASWETYDKVRPNFGFDEFAKLVANLGLNYGLAPKVITVAGTNGKGSCVQALVHLSQLANLNVFSYTSPHLQRINERFCYNGKPINSELLWQYLSLACTDYALSFFEQLTVTAFYLAKHLSVDVAIFEVGLGGRLDAVNATQHDCAVITSIDLDHQHILGDSLDEIAIEKAGIIKSGSKFVWGGGRQVPAVILAAARAKNVEVICDDLIKNKTSLLPQQSLHAAKLVWQTMFHNLPISNLDSQLAKVTLPGRFEVVKFNNNLIILDIAHNPAACSLLVDLLVANGYNNLEAIVAFSVDKDIKGCIAALKSVVINWHWLQLEHNLRIAKNLSKIVDLKALGIVGNNLSMLGLKQLFVNSTSKCFLVSGSCYTVGAVRELIV